jgi:hypothetical protein
VGKIAFARDRHLQGDGHVVGLMQHLYGARRNKSTVLIAKLALFDWEVTKLEFGNQNVTISINARS